MIARPPLLLLLAALAAPLATPLAAQTESGRSLSVSSWAAPYVEHLVRAGVLRGLDPLSRPLRYGDVARALAAVDTEALAAPARATVRLLQREFGDTAAPDDSVRWRVAAAGGALAASDPSRWALRPGPDTARLLPQLGVEASLEMPHLVLVTHPRIDNRLKYDPDYHGKKDRFIAGRNEDAYVAWDSRWAGVFFGIVDRNWGPPEAEGLLLSPSAYGFDHFLVRLGPRRFRIELLATQLDDLTPWGDSLHPVSRALTLHRLVVVPSDAVAFSLFEGVVYAGTANDPRAIEPWYLNPLNSLLLQQFQDVPGSNALVGLDASARVRGSLRLAGQFYLDDIQIDRRTAGDREPPSYGFTLVGTGGFARGAGSWSALYTRVTNLSYRTPLRQEQYSLRGLGIARNWSDYDQATVRATADAAPRLLASLELTWLRQGEGDFRLPYPQVADYPTTPTFLQGVVERTARVAAQAVWTPVPDVTLSADVGRHFIANAGHVSGRSAQRWVWRVGVEVRRAAAGTLRVP